MLINKKCHKCGHLHTAKPAVGIDHSMGFYFQCEGSCDSTLFLASPEAKAVIEAFRARKVAEALAALAADALAVD